MKKTTFLCILMLLFTASFASAAYLDILPNTPDPIIVNPGDPFHVDIYLVGTAAENLNTYSFDIRWDPGELVLQSVTPLSATEIKAPGFFDLAPVFGFDGSSTLINYDGFSLTGGLNLGGGPYPLGSIDFNVVSPLFDGSDDVFVTYRTGQGFGIGASTLQISSNGPDLGPTPVPLPSAILLMAPMVLGAFGLRRKKRKDA
jgi:hypothetical protein